MIHKRKESNHVPLVLRGGVGLPTVAPIAIGARLSAWKAQVGLPTVAIGRLSVWKAQVGGEA
jgi:hypothetical protein